MKLAFLTIAAAFFGATSAAPFQKEASIVQR